jgi:hypothetical protein
MAQLNIKDPKKDTMDYYLFILWIYSMIHITIRLYLAQQSLQKVLKRQSKYI